MALILRSTARLLLLFGVLLFLNLAALAQQPFVTDDADVTPKRKFHFEFSNEFDWLSASAFPSLKQNTADFELDYGLFEGVEIGFEIPHLTISNDRATVPRRPSGFGDANVSLKYNFLTEREGLRRPALAISFNLELPTGDKSRLLGSGLADFYMNGILQKSVTSNTKVRLNGGVLFSGNETTGVLGIKTRGTVFTSGGSVVRQFGSKLDLGMELVGAISTSLNLGKSQLQTMVSGNYLLRDNITFDFGIVAGKHVGSPRVGVQLGISIDW
ncbi:MAG TPA: hypothetical protein VF251_15830 [Pyrinomonadaceae bacterium]